MRSRSSAPSSSVEVPAETSLTTQHEATYDVFENPNFLGFDVDEDKGDHADVSDSMTYSVGWLRTRLAFCVLSGTVWDNRIIWNTMGKLLMVSVIVGVLEYNFMPNPSVIDASKFSEISGVFNVFVSLALGFYLNSSVKRWHSCVNEFLGLFNMIRNMSMQLHSFGVPEDKTKLCLRYCVVSIVFLVHDLGLPALSAAKGKEATDTMWTHLLSSQSTYSRIELDEKQELLLINDKCSQMWVWVASFLGRLSMDGVIPAMSGPTFARISHLCHDAQENIREVKMSVVVQMPFVYTHLLAVLVQTNCVIIATCSGLALGVTLHGIRNYAAHYYYDAEVQPGVVVVPLCTLIQDLIVELMKGVFGSLLYQAFLDIAIVISSPFSRTESAIPVNRLIQQLERDLSDAAIMAENTVKWKQPYYTPPQT
mmetsp:Transcript_76520/g.212522  ORF Transcript_76520/g.212522 Transcript_76520/m.212522 type:complete len:423 (-) Transcript_76520:195-1463(-)